MRGTFGVLILLAVALMSAPPAAPASETDAPPLSTGAASPGESSGLERAWFGAGASLERRAEHTRRRALEVGADNLEPAARALLAADDEDHALRNARLAVGLAPDLPIAHMTLAGAYWREGEYRECFAQIFASLAAIPRHLEASLWIAASLLVVISAVFVAGSLAFVFAVGVAGFSRAAHDLGDLLSSHLPGFARSALLFALIGIPVALGEGLLGLMLGVLGIGFVYGGPRYRVVLGLAVALFMLGLYPLLQLAGTALDALDADPVATASLAVVRDTARPAQVALLQEAELQGDGLAARVLAARSMRLGDFDRARERFGRLFEEDAADPLVLTSLGNMAFRAGRTDEAIGFYERARAVGESAVLLFDLSQAYARGFRMEEFELTLQRAQTLDADVVAELSGFADPGFVADVPFPIAPIRSRMFARADGGALVDAAVAVVAPGWIGRSPTHVAAAFLLVLLGGSLLTGRYQQAGRCGRCGRRICARCDDSMWSSELCDGCHHLFNRPQGTDPQLRMTRISALRRREARVEKASTLASVVVPGVSGLLARRPDLSLVSILFFLAAVALFAWRGGVVPDPLAVGHAGPLAFVAAGVVMFLLYAGVMLSGILIRRSQ